MFLLVSLLIVSKFEVIFALTGGLLDLRRSSNYPLLSFKKSCTRDLESCTPSPLLRKIDTLRFGP